MKLANLVKNFNTKQVFGKFSDLTKGAVSSSPLPTLLQPLNTIYNTLLVRQSSQDAFNLAMVGVEPLFDAAVNDDEGISSELIDITEEQASAVSSAIVQAVEELSDTGQESVLNISSGVGMNYAIQIESQIDNDDSGSVLSWVTAVGKKPLLYRDYVEDHVRYRISNYAYPRSYREAVQVTVPQCDDILSAVQRIFDASIVASGHSLANWSGNYDIMSMLKLAYSFTFNSEPLEDTFTGIIREFALMLDLDPACEDYADLIMIWNSVFTSTLPEVTVNTAKEKLLSVIKSSVISAEINSIIAQVICAIKNSRIVSTLDAVWDSFVTRYESTKQLISRMKNALSTGGIKGLIYFIFSIFKKGTSVTDEDGIFRFTDNSIFTPKEYIAGLLASVISAATAVAGLLVSFFSKVFGVIITAISSVFTNIIQSFKYDRTQTVAALYVPNDGEEGVNVVSSTPAGLLRFIDSSTSFEDLPPWYKAYFIAGEPCVTIDVIGGEIFVGPNAFDDEGQPSSLRYEFHSSAICYDREWVKSVLGSAISCESAPTVEVYACSLDVSSLIRSVLNIDDAVLTKDHLTDCLKTIYAEGQSHAVSVSNNLETNVLDGPDDMNQYCSCVMNTLLFSLWWLSESGWSAVRDLINGNTLVRGLTNTHDTDDEKILDVFSHFLLWAGTSVNPGVSWANFISFCDLTNSAGAFIPTVEASAFPEWSYLDVQGIMLSGNFRFILGKLYSGEFFNSPSVLPAEYVYPLIYPRYNSSSFFAWLALSIATVAVATVATVVATVAWKRFAKSKRASNVAQFGKKQETFQNAAKGIRTEIDPETGEPTEITFDVNSREGQRYIKQAYKDYKRQAMKNNLWQKLVGGSRYDVGSFWGEADEEESESTDYMALMRESNDDLDSDATDSDLTTNVVDPTQGFTALHQIITGESLM